MGRPILFLKQIVFLVLWLGIGPFGGCALFQESPDVEPAMPREKKWISKYEVLVKESRAEADRLRSELAAVRIAAAKNNGNFRPTRGGMGTPTKEEEELTAEVETLKADIAKVKEERDQLRHQNVQLQARSEALPGMRQLVMDIKALQTSVHQLVTKMESLSTDIAQVKQDIILQEQALQTVPSKLTARPAEKLPDPPPNRPSIASSAPDRLVTPGSDPETALITVEWGDTLWDIARSHDISVEKLKEMNGLTSDAIFEDQQLKVPLPYSQPTKPNSPAALAAQQSEKPSNDATDKEGAPKLKEGP